MGKLVGIAGGSGSGKSTLARQVVAAGAGDLALVAIDSFYYSLKPGQRPEEINYDHPESLDFELLQRCLDDLTRGHPVSIPTYDFALHMRNGQRELRPAKLVVVEGILALADEGVRERLHMSVFVTAPEPVRFHRRLARDMRDRGRSEASVREQWQRTVEPMHRQFVEPTREVADVVVDGTECFDTAVAQILDRAQRL